MQTILFIIGAAIFGGVIGGLIVGILIIAFLTFGGEKDERNS